MKLTREILWDDNFINKFTNLRTSFLIFLTRILIDTKEKYHQLYDASWLTAELKNEFSVTNYYPHVVYKPKFGKPIISYKSKENDIKYAGEKIKFEDGIKYIMNKIFFDLKYDSEIELFGIKISNFITKDNKEKKNEMIESMFKYLSDKFVFPSQIEYFVNDKPYYIECVYKVFTSPNKFTSNLDLYFTISFKLCSGESDTPISFKNDSLTEFDLFYKDLKDKAKKFICKQKEENRTNREMNKYL